MSSNEICFGLRIIIFVVLLVINLNVYPDGMVIITPSETYQLCKCSDIISYHIM